MKVLIIGATGKTGAMLTERALSAGHEVTVLVRDASKLREARVHVESGDATNASDVERAVSGKDVVVAILSPKNANDPVRSQAARVIVDAMKKNDVARLVWVSASGVGDSKQQMIESSFVFGRIIMPLFLGKQYADAAVAEQVVAASGLDFTVVRPVQLVDKSAKNDVGVSFGGKLTQLQIARADLALFLSNEIDSGAYRGRMPVVYA